MMPSVAPIVSSSGACGANVPTFNGEPSHSAVIDSNARIDVGVDVVDDVKPKNGDPSGPVPTYSQSRMPQTLGPHLPSDLDPGEVAATAAVAAAAVAAAAVAVAGMQLSGLIPMTMAAAEATDLPMSRTLIVPVMQRRAQAPRM